MLPGSQYDTVSDARHRCRLKAYWSAEVIKLSVLLSSCEDDNTFVKARSALLQVSNF